MFVGLLSLQSLAGNAADTGGAPGGEILPFQLCAGGGRGPGGGIRHRQRLSGTSQTTLGGFGILATALIVLPPLLECVAWSLCLSLCVMAAEMFGLETLPSLLKTAQSVVKTLIGVLAFCSLFMIVATTIVTMAAPG